MKPESTVQQELQIEAKTYDCNLMRNNCGMLKTEDGRVVRFGLGNVSKQHQDKIASSDLIGFTRLLITPEMVGHVVAVFTAVECKEEKWNHDKKLNKRETAQLNFINWIQMNGGFAGFASHVDNLQGILRQ